MKPVYCSMTKIPSLRHQYKSVIALMLLAAMLVGCASNVRTLSKEELAESRDAYFKTYQEEVEISLENNRQRIITEARQQNPSFDILILSGGGEYGAFGAGFLQGWGEIQDPIHARPVFDSVTGISTGALIAPFAFAGTSDAYQTIVNLYQNPRENLAVSRPILPFLFGDGSYFDASVLHRFIEENISTQLVSQIADGGRDNRILLVGATNLDYGVMRTWDLTQYALTETNEEAKKNIAEKLIASSAIPGAFPPVEIDKFLYVDGGAVSSLFGSLGDRNDFETNQNELEAILTRSHPVNVRVWVIVNGKLRMEPEVTTNSWSTVATRSLETLLKSSTMQTVMDIQTLAILIDQMPMFNVTFNFVSIPQSYETPKTKTLFDTNKMRGLVELGRKMGRDVNSWKQDVPPAYRLYDIE